MKNYSDAITALRELLGKRLATSAAELCLHGQNETYYPNTPPDAVAYLKQHSRYRKLSRSVTNITVW